MIFVIWTLFWYILSKNNHNFGEIEIEGVMRDRHITMMAEFMVGFKLEKSFFLIIVTIQQSTIMTVGVSMKLFK